MIRSIWVALDIFLILIIFLRMPQETVGLSSFANKSDILGSPTSAQKTLNIITGLSVIAYIFFAFKLNSNI